MDSKSSHKTDQQTAANEADLQSLSRMASNTRHLTPTERSPQSNKQLKLKLMNNTYILPHSGCSPVTQSLLNLPTNTDALNLGDINAYNAIWFSELLPDPRDLQLAEEMDASDCRTHRTQPHPQN